MIAIRSIFLFLWLLVTGAVCLFSFWRKLRSERVDREDELIDRLIVLGFFAAVVGRLTFIAFHWSSFTSDILQWLDVFSHPGMVGGVALVFLFLLYRRFTRNNWKDEIEILDYLSITLALFIALFHLGELLISAIVTLIGLGMKQVSVVPVVDIKQIVLTFVVTLFFFGLFAFLSSVERRYRTFLWYRSKRRSAQTGFVLASFFIGYGAIGGILGWLRTSSMNIGAVKVDPIFALLVMIAGFVILYLRSGRTILPKRS